MLIQFPRCGILEAPIEHMKMLVKELAGINSREACDDCSHPSLEGERSRRKMKGEKHHV